MFYGFGTANLKDVIGFDYVQWLIIAVISLVFFGIIYFIVSKRRNIIKNAIGLAKKEYWFKHPDFFYTHAFSAVSVCANAQNILYILSTDTKYDRFDLWEMIPRGGCFCFNDCNECHFNADIEYDNIVLNFFDMEDFLDSYCSGIKGKMLARHARTIIRRYILNTLNIEDSRVIMMGV